MLPLQQSRTFKVDTHLPSARGNLSELTSLACILSVYYLLRSSKKRMSFLSPVTQHMPSSTGHPQSIWPLSEFIPILMISLFLPVSPQRVRSSVQIRRHPLQHHVPQISWESERSPQRQVGQFRYVITHAPLPLCFSLPLCGCLRFLPTTSASLRQPDYIERVHITAIIAASIRAIVWFAYSPTSWTLSQGSFDR